MPHRIAGRGTYRLDRTFPGVGRIARATGTNKARTFDAINAMLSALFETGRLDVLRRLRDAELHPMVAFSEWRETGTIRAQTGTWVRAMVDWVEQAAVGSDARYSYRAQVKRLVARYPNAGTDELPDLLRAQRLTLTPASFRVLRTATLAFLRDTVGRRSEIYLGVKDVDLKRERTRAPTPFMVEEIAALPTDVFAEAVTMFTTGMGAREYFSGKWAVEGDALHIRGTKRAGRDRLVPLLLEPILPRCQARWYRPKLKAAAPGHVLYDLRRGYAHLLETAGVPPSRIKAYMGHGARVMTDSYLRHDVLPHLAEDAGRVAPLLAPLHRQALRMQRGVSA